MKLTAMKEEEKKAQPPRQVSSILGLFRYAETADKVMMVVGSIGAVGLGVIQPCISLLIGGVLNAFIEYGMELASLPPGSIPSPAARQKVQDEVFYNIYLFLIIGGAALVAAYIMKSMWMSAGLNQSRRVRLMFMTSILDQDLQFFDENEIGDLTTRLSTDTTLYQEGISEKAGYVVMNCTTFVAGFVIAFAKGWQLTLVLLTSLPVLSLGGYMVGKAISSGTSDAQAAYGKAGAVAQETLGNIRTVVAFNGQDRATAKFQTYLDDAYKVGLKKAWQTGAGFGFFFSILYGLYALAFWYGSLLVAKGELQGGDILNVVFAIIIGAFSIINLTPALEALNKARGVATGLFQVIEKRPVIDCSDSYGKKPEKCFGKIEFKNVTFAYPSRPNDIVLKDFSLVIEPGETVALVGFSGSGKSTAVQLLERFYDPLSGVIEFDGIPVNQLNVKWLRKNLGLVSQEPMLFDTTVEENIRIGASDPKAVTLAELKAVIETANATKFVSTLASGMNTRVGERGSQFSGGQKQRIAIARALIKNPPVLLLDEATSALDTEAERIVQTALDNASKSRTTLVIAHRLSTIKKANKIVVMQKGEIVESGTHLDLIDKNGAYAALVKAQEVKSGSNAAVSEDQEPEEIAETTEKSPNVADAADDAILTGKEVVEDEIDHVAIDNKRLAAMKAPLMRIFKLQRSELHYVFGGILMSACNGALFPLFGLVFGQVLAVYAKPRQEMLDGAAFWSLIFLGIMVANFFINLLQFGLFGSAGERLTRRVREMEFHALLRQEIAFFDEPIHGTGALTARLADDATKIQQLTGPVMGTILQLLVSMGLAMGLAFYYSWQLTLIVLATVPIMAFSGIIETKSSFQASNSDEVKQAYAMAAQTSCDAIQNIRTVKAMNSESRFVAEYQTDIDVPHQKALKSARYGSLGYALSQGTQFWIYSIAFYGGYRLVFAGILAPADLFTVLFSIVFGAISFGQAAVYLADYTKAKVAATAFYELMDRVPNPDSYSQEGEKPIDATASVDLKDVQFSYPQRADIPILRGMSLQVSEHQNIALVGPSGAGKSSVIAMIERFYIPGKGSIDVGGHKIENWNIQHLRTIAENICYGKPNSSQGEMEQAATMANIHTFIDSLPKKYDTEISNTQLSGGQKQRIAIARALLTSPKFLLLDEATSALDSASETAVQEALLAAAKDRTTITIAHRLSTVQNCDLIVVMKDGHVEEFGNHSQLLSKRGLYYALAQEQRLAK